jgi:hypothetical protein
MTCLKTGFFCDALFTCSHRDASGDGGTARGTYPPPRRAAAVPAGATPAVAAGADAAAVPAGAAPAIAAAGAAAAAAAGGSAAVVAATVRAPSVVG